MFWGLGFGLFFFGFVFFFFLCVCVCFFGGWGMGWDMGLGMGFGYFGMDLEWFQNEFGKVWKAFGCVWGSCLCGPKQPHLYHHFKNQQMPGNSMVSMLIKPERPSCLPVFPGFQTRTDVQFHLLRRYLSHLNLKEVIGCL